MRTVRALTSCKNHWAGKMSQSPVRMVSPRWYTGLQLWDMQQRTSWAVLGLGCGTVTEHTGFMLAKAGGDSLPSHGNLSREQEGFLATHFSQRNVNRNGHCSIRIPCVSSCPSGFFSVLCPASLAPTTWHGAGPCRMPHRPMTRRTSEYSDEVPMPLHTAGCYTALLSI